MAEFFLELFSEEIPANLQKNARINILENFQKFFTEKNLDFKNSKSYSTPNRLIVLFEGLDKNILQKSQEIRGPNINAPEIALQGFLRSNNLEKKDVYTKKIEKGEFYFYKKLSKNIRTSELLEMEVPKILEKISWKKSMKWGDFDLSWARPLKSILAIFNNRILEFKFHHLKSSNTTFIDKDFEDKKKIFKNFKEFQDYFRNIGVILDQNLRKNIIEKELKKTAKRKNILIEINQKLLEEVTDLVEKPHILACKFDKKFLEIPKEILIITLQHHQKYFHSYDKKENITNEFLVVANNKDIKNFIKIGNERVIEARLSDAQFFWNKNKSKNLVKQVSKLKTMNYFNGLGTYFDKIQRMRKLGGMISDEILIGKDKVELSATICKIDLMSDLVNEFPELQGIMGGYFAEAQSFDKSIALAISEHYLPIGLEGKLPKKPFSIALALTDKLDTLIGFFGIEQKPTSSKDPYALRRAGLGIIRILVENKKQFKVKDLINYSISLYKEQGFKLKNNAVYDQLIDFFMDRLKYYMKEKGIRNDIIEAGTTSYGINQLSQIYQKCFLLNKIIKKENGINIISSYKRSANILYSEKKDIQLQPSNFADPGLFKNEYEKNLYKKITELKKYFNNINKDENYETSLNKLADSKKVIYEFFDNVMVNDEEKRIKKNRLELLQMLCKTFDNYINFSNIETI